MKIGEYCNREVVVVEKDDSILEAARIMRKYHVGNVVVAVEENGMRVPVGILTDRDIVIEVLAVEVDVHTVNSGDVMSSDLLTVNEGEYLLDCLKLMRGRGVRRVVVVNDGGGLAGILTLDDIVEIIAEQMTEISGLISREQSMEREKLI